MGKRQKRLSKEQLEYKLLYLIFKYKLFSSSSIAIHYAISTTTIPEHKLNIQYETTKKTLKRLATKGHITYGAGRYFVNKNIICCKLIIR